jgi:23S rRNA G2069 N7-methylase RlmK/C1962 C5-methylase RlmI
MKSNGKEKQFKEEIVSTFSLDSDILSAKEYFDEKNIKYEIWDKQKSEATRIDKFLDKNDKTLTAFYWIDNSGFITTYYAVYLLYDSKDKLKRIVFETFYRGP